MKKIDKEFVLSDSSVNCYGYRLLTEGYMLAEFAKNPIGYYMHDRDAGILVKWERLAKKGDEIIGYPNINEANPRGDRTIDEINAGFLNAASMGHIVPVEFVDDPALRLPGQTGPTITKWYNRECSLVDIPGNYNALQLYDADDNPLNMNLFYKERTQSEIEDDETVEENLDVNKLLKAAIDNKDITQEQAAELKKLYYETPKKLLTALHEFAALRMGYIQGLSWDELDKNGLLEELKEKYLAGFQKKYYLKFGKHYKDPKEKESKQDEPDIKRLIQYALDQGDIDEALVEAWQKNFANDPVRLRGLINDRINVGIRKLKNKSWDSLDKDGGLEDLKKFAFQSFKEKYKEKFGIDYKENTK
jgi:hypothetical protein